MARLVSRKMSTNRKSVKSVKYFVTHKVTLYITYKRRNLNSVNTSVRQLWEMRQQVAANFIYG